MAVLASILLVVSAAVVCVADPTLPPRYTVNLDLVAEDRWIHVIKDYPHFTVLIRKLITQVVPSSFLPIVDGIGNFVLKHIKDPYAAEIKGMAKAANIGAGELTIINVIYDIATFCTSIVAQDEAGHIWHARNLDYTFTDSLRNVTIITDFQKKNDTVYTGVTFVGYVGLLTAQKPGRFTISANSRNEGDWWLNLLIYITRKSAVPVSFLVRDTMELAKDFPSAVQMLASTITVAPVYFNVGGARKGEGAIVTKARLRAVDVWYLDSLHGRWYLVETNYDHWKPVPSSDDRRDIAIKAMDKMGNKTIAVSSLYKVLSLKRILRTITIYTAVMSPNQPLKAWIRNHTEI